METIYFNFYEEWCHHFFLFFPNLLPFLPSSGIYLYIFYYFVVLSSCVVPLFFFWKQIRILLAFLRCRLSIFGVCMFMKQSKPHHHCLNGLKKNSKKLSKANFLFVFCWSNEEGYLCCLFILWFFHCVVLCCVVFSLYVVFFRFICAFFNCVVSRKKQSINNFSFEYYKFK